MIRLKPNELAGTKEIPSFAPATLTKSTHDALASTTRLTGAVRAFAASFSERSVVLMELLTETDRALVGLTYQLAAELGIDVREVDNLAIDLRAYRASGVEQLPTALPALAGPSRVEVPAGAPVQGPIVLDRGFVLSLFDAERMPAPTVSLTLVRQLVLKLTPPGSELIPRFAALLERHAARLGLHGSLRALAPALVATPELTHDQVRQGFLLVRQRTAQTLLPAAPLTRGDRALLVTLYAAAKSQQVPAAVVDDLAGTLRAVRAAESVVMAQSSSQVPGPSMFPHEAGATLARAPQSHDVLDQAHVVGAAQTDDVRVQRGRAPAPHAFAAGTFERRDAPRSLASESRLMGGHEEPARPLHAEGSHVHAAFGSTAQLLARSTGAYRSFSTSQARTQREQANAESNGAAAHTSDHAASPPAVTNTVLAATAPSEIAQALGLSPLFARVRAQAAARKRAAPRKPAEERAEQHSAADERMDERAEQERMLRRQKRWRTLLGRRRRVRRPK